MTAPPRTPDKEKQHLLKTIGLLSVIVAELLGYTGAGIAIGYLAVQRLDAPQWVLPVASFAGFCLAMYQVYQVSKKEWEDGSDEKDEKR